MGLARLDEPLEGIGDGEEEGSKKLQHIDREDGDEESVLGRLHDSLRIVQSGYLWRLSRSGSLGSSVELDLQEVAAGGSRAASVGPPAARWTRRWFVLRADACLYFFKTENVSAVSLVFVLVVLLFVVVIILVVIVCAAAAAVVLVVFVFVFVVVAAAAAVVVVVSAAAATTFVISAAAATTFVVVAAATFFCC